MKVHKVFEEIKNLLNIEDIYIIETMEAVINDIINGQKMYTCKDYMNDVIEWLCIFYNIETPKKVFKNNNYFNYYLFKQDLLILKNEYYISKINL